VNRSDRITPIAAAASAIASLACCLPVGFAAAAATASLGLVMQALRPWLLGLSVVLLGVGMHQVYGTKGACVRRSRTSVVLLWSSAVIVVLVIMFPQLLAAVLADWLP
jgi:hypothetical protein